MKKILVTLLCAAFFASLQAQSPKLGVGAKVGVNISTLITDDDELEDWGPLVGPHMGAYLYYMPSKFVGVEVGLMYTQAGFSLEIYDGFNASYEDIDIKLSYFAVPVSARFKFGYFTLNPGVQLGFLTGATQDGDDISDDIEKLDIGVFLAPGVEFPFGLKINASAIVGLSNLRTDIDDYHYSNVVFQVSVGYTFLRIGDNDD